MHEQAGVSGTLPSLAGKIRADILGKVSWEDVRDVRLEIPEIEHSHVLLICISDFNYLYLLFGSVFTFLLFPPSKLAGLRFASQ